MDSKQTQCAVIEFLIKKGCRLFDIHRWLKNTNRDDTTDKSNVDRWLKKSERGETGNEDKPLSGRPSTGAKEDFREDLRVGFNDGTNASLVIEIMLSSTFV